ncbi:MAG TPA: molybdenum cofactor guanylyltransferase [Ktedonobacteraceae bacterium]|nr:molybdenum cofactor guanylyltransferase [Ktedonobacteraceae bacterium]
MTVAGIILAGGQSRRMGKEKALLPLPGNEQITFVEHLVTLLNAFCSEVVLVARDAAQAGELAGSDRRIVLDEVPGVGPLMGLWSGLRAMNASHALVTAVDMPFVQPAVVSCLLAHAPDDALLVPMVQGVAQVLLAVYPRTIIPVIEERLREGRRDPRSLLTVAKVRYIEEAQLREYDPQLRSFVNVNTPQELAHYASGAEDQPV